MRPKRIINNIIIIVIPVDMGKPRHGVITQLFPRPAGRRQQQGASHRGRYQGLNCQPQNFLKIIAKWLPKLKTRHELKSNQACELQKLNLECGGVEEPDLSLVCSPLCGFPGTQAWLSCVYSPLGKLTGSCRSSHRKG